MQAAALASSLGFALVGGAVTGERAREIRAVNLKQRLRRKVLIKSCTHHINQKLKDKCNVCRFNNEAAVLGTASEPELL